ncbi:MAG: DUF3108 domain-containing protein [Pseudomonadota bacterium]
MDRISKLSLMGLVGVMAILTVSSPALAKPGQNWAIEGFEASYKVKVGIASAGAVVRLNALGDNRFEIVSETRAKGFASLFKRGEVYERAVFQYVDGEILAESLVRKDTLSADDRNCEVYYRPLENEATVIYQGEASIVEIPRDTFNPLLMQIALMQDMALGNTPERYNILDHAGLKSFDVSFGSEGSIDTPTGAYAAVPVDLVNLQSNAGTRMWAAPEQDWLAVVVEARKDDEVKAVLRLSNLEDS